MQIQLDPNIPTNLSPEELRDFKTFLDTALEGLTAAAGAEIFTMGNQMLGFLAVIVVVLSGLKIAFSGNIQPWELVRGVIGIWIPWVMLQFYTTNIPGMVHTFPGMIAAGGNWLHLLLIGDSLYGVQTELTDLFRSLAKAQDAAIEAGDLINIFTSGLQASMTAVAGFVMVIFLAFMLLILAAVTYAQVIWAQVALAILIILGPIFIPFLVFDPLSFLFWAGSGRCSPIRSTPSLPERFCACSVPSESLTSRAWVTPTWTWTASWKWVCGRSRSCLSSSPECWQASSAGNSPRCSSPEAEQPEAA